MLILKDKLLNVPVMSLQTGSELARTGAPIIDPRQLRVVAFYCNGPGLGTEASVLHVSDIRELSEIGMIVDSADIIMPSEDLVRLQEVIGLDFRLEGKQVVEDSGHKVGKVMSYSVENETFYVAKLHVRPGLLHALQATELIIDRSQICEITDTHIVVKSAVIKDEHPAKAVQRLVENPFRAQKPQPDMVRESRQSS